MMCSFVFFVLFVFFFKQKTAYEMRISDWSSDVCSSDLDGAETGVMHACGRDTHMTAFIETARLLSSMKEDWKGTLVMILQPAEEVGRGARLMLEDGLYTRFPRPTHAIDRKSTRLNSSH